MRLSCFAESNVPPEYAGAFCHDGTWRAGVDLSQLPAPMRGELAWCVFRIIELGGKIPTPGLSMLVRRLGEVIADRAGRAPASLLGLPVRDWCQQIQRAVHRRRGRLPAATTMKHIRCLLTRMMRLLVTASDTGPWWQRDRWNPFEDNRTPLREHEPMGRYSVRFDRIGTRWLRRGLQWHCKVGLETGSLSWSTVHRRIVAVSEFDGFLGGRGVDGPWLVDHAAGTRTLMLEFLGHLRARPVTRGRGTGQRLSPASMQRLASDVEQYYLFMIDNKDAAAAALAEPGWRRLGPEHAGFYRRGELPGKPRPRLDGQVIDDDAMTRITGGLDLLGATVADGGFGDKQAMRITMLVALLGRRVSEICLLDRDPLLPLSPTAPSSPGDPAADGDELGLVAKLRYQQTKIDGAPDTIPVHAEVGRWRLGCRDRRVSTHLFCLRQVDNFRSPRDAGPGCRARGPAPGGGCTTEPDRAAAQTGQAAGLSRYRLCSPGSASHHIVRCSSNSISCVAERSMNSSSSATTTEAISGRARKTSISSSASRDSYHASVM